MSHNKREMSLMAKPIEATPVLKGKDLINLAKAIEKKDSQESKHHRRAALSLLEKITK